MKEGDEIPLDGFDLDEPVELVQPADDMGIPMDGDDDSPGPSVSAAYGIDLQSAASITHDNSYDGPAPTPRMVQAQRSLPPVLRAIATIYQRNVSGTLNVSEGETVFMSMFIKDGRILNVAHADLSHDAIGALLLGSGLITQRRLKKAVRQSRAVNTTLDSYLAASRTVSSVSIHHIVDSRCAELVLQIMREDGLKVSFSRTQPEGLRKNCQIPLPWLLKEFKRRDRERAAIMARIPDMSVAFVRTSELQTEPSDELWEDIELSAAEKQVYFFVDGARTVDDLAMATGQSRFAVMRAVAGMIESGDIVTTLEPAKRRKTRHTLRSSGRAVLMLAVLLLTVAGMGVAFLNGQFIDIGEISGMRSSAWGDLFTNAAEHRVKGAVLVHRLITTDVDPAPDKLLSHGLILPSDIHVAVSMYKAAVDETDKANEPEPVVDPVGP